MEQWEPVSRGRYASQSNAPPCKPSNAPCELRVIEWHHMDLRLFYPMALTSTWTVRVMLYPLDVLRTRLQLQKQTTVYRSTWDAFRRIAKHEGVGGLFRGFWVTIPKLGTSFIYSTVYEKLRATLQQDYGLKSAALVSSIAGGAASFCSQPIFVPMDIISQHMMIYNYADKFISGNDRRIIEHLRQDGVTRGALGWRTIKAIYKCDGPSGFYRGFWASAAVYVPICLISWPVYYWTQDFLKAIHGDRNFLLLDQAISATVGGAAATVGTNPMEIFRARLQVHRTNYRDTLERMLRDEGLSLFTKGLAPRLINNSTFSCIVMVGYEVVKRMCVLPEYKDAVRW